MRLSVHRRSQETKWSSSAHLLIAHPASLTMVVAVMTSRPSIWVRSVCETTLRASRTAAYSLSSSGAVPSASPQADASLGSDPHSAGDAARAADRMRPSAAGKTRNPVVPASARTAGLLASCPPDTARSVPRSPAPEDPEARPAYAHRVGPPEWP